MLTLTKQTKCHLSMDLEQVDALYHAIMRVLELSYSTKHEVVLEKDEFLVLYELVKCLERSEAVHEKRSYGDEMMAGREKITLRLSADDVNEIIRNVLVSKGYEVLEEANFQVCEAPSHYSADVSAHQAMLAAPTPPMFAGATYVVSRNRI